MTRNRSFKRLVRARMAKTGQSYTAARAALLNGPAPVASASTLDDVHLPTSDAAIRERTGRGWEEWFDLLDDWGAAERSHREIARWVAEQQGVVPLAWNAQAVTAAYERARLGKAVGEHDDGFAVHVSRTASAHVERLFDVVMAASGAPGWLPEGSVSLRTATRPKSARFDAPGGSRIAVTFTAKGDAKSTLSLTHARLADADAADEMKMWWRKRLDALVASSAGGGDDA